MVNLALVTRYKGAKDEDLKSGKIFMKKKRS